MALKILLDFYDGGVGWTETYYFGALTDPMRALDDMLTETVLFGAVPDLRRWFLGRLGVLSKAVYIVAVRCGVDGAFRQALTKEVNPVSGRGRAVTAPGVGETESFSTLLVNFWSGLPDINRKALYLGGVPEENLDSPQSYAPTVRFSAAMKLFLDQCKTAGVNLKIRPKVADPTNKLIVSFVPDSDGRTALLQPNVLGDVIGNKGFVIIRGVKNPRGWNGIHTGLVVGVGIPPQPFLSIGPTRKPMVTAPIYDRTEGGHIQAYGVPTYPPIATYQVQRFVEHKRGRFFAQPRGRRS